MEVHVSLNLIARGLALVLALGGCGKTMVPEGHTSLSLDPGADPGKPAEKLTMLWHHHSTGDSLLDGGLRAALESNNIDFHDINYEEASVEGYVIGDHTDPPDFPKNFNTPKYFDVLKSWELTGEKKQHDIIMFKSCFPASNIDDDAMLAQYQGYYNSLLPTFKAHPDILFIAMSTPPLVKRDTSPERAARARTWSKWLTTEWVKGAHNVRAFDLFGSLAILEGKPDENTLTPQFATSRDDSHPSPAGARAVTRLFIPWLNRALRDG
jgi:hypothetical protein